MGVRAPFLACVTSLIHIVHLSVNYFAQDILQRDDAARHLLLVVLADVEA
jgi:hypothetical protein